MQITYWLTSSNRNPIFEFLDDCSQEVRSDFVDSISWLAAGETLALPLSRNLSSIFPGLHELRLKDRSGQYRFFYFVKKKEGIWVLHAIKKKTQELPHKDIELVLKRIKEI
jgi:phage-related protein